jgi:hypothetical protein
MQKYQRFWRSVAVVVGLMVAAVTWVAQGASSNLNPGVLPPLSKPYGMSYGQWSVRWWQWVFSLPANNNPILDTGDCSAGQSGPVWFLGGRPCRKR